MAIKKIFFCFAFFVLSIGVANGALKEGVDYQVLKTPIPNAKNSVIEVYSYACPFCYKYSKFINKIIATLPNNVKFKPYHLMQKGEWGKEVTEVLAFLAASDIKAGIDINSPKSSFHKAQMAYFETYHIDKNKGKDAESYIQLGLDSSGFSKADFENGLNDKSVQDIINAWSASLEAAIVQGVPAFIVNGKYIILTKSIASLEDLQNKIKELLKK